MNPRLQLRTTVGLLALLLAAAPLVAFGGSNPLRTVVAFGAFLFVPGGALLTLLRTSRMTEWVGLAIAFSLALEVAGSLVLVWTGWWRPAVLAAILAAGSAALLVNGLRRQVKELRCQ